jgi:ParB-like chromosome segregation protein Spo0J
MSFGFELTPLILSIKRIGLVNSPLLIEDGRGTMEIVSGYRRIQAVKSLKWEKISCRVLQESDISELECLLLSLHENLATRSFNLAEKGMILSRLMAFFSHAEILKDYMPLLEIPSHEETLRLFLKIENELEESIKLSLARGQTSLRVVKMLLDLDPHSRAPVFSLISDIKLNINKQVQLINYIFDISQKNRETVPEFLKGLSLEKIYSEKQLNTPQKAKAVFRLLRAKRFPSLTEAETTFKKMVSRLNLPERVRIEPPPFFESPDYRLEILFKEGKELKEKIGYLFEKEEIEKLGNPWEMSI